MEGGRVLLHGCALMRCRVSVVSCRTISGQTWHVHTCALTPLSHPCTTNYPPCAVHALWRRSAQVVKMVSHHGGSKNLVAVRESLPALQAVGFTSGHVVQMVSHHGGCVSR